MADDPLNAPPAGADLESLERKFWKNVTLNPPLYGADVPGSLFDADTTKVCPPCPLFLCFLSAALPCYVLAFFNVLGSLFDAGTTKACLSHSAFCT